MSEKTEKASSYKLKKARKNGQVSKSTELNTCVFLLVLFSISIALGPSCFNQIKELLTHLIQLNSRMQFSIDNLSKLQFFIMSKIIFLWLPFAISGLLSITLSNIVQTGFVWSLKPISPDFNRLNIINGFKRLFSTKTLFEACKNSIKLILAFLILSISIHCKIEQLLGFIITTPSHFLPLLTSLVSVFMLQLLILFFAVATIDKLYTHWKFGNDQRMSKQEVKDEYRQREGDPTIKAKIKQLQQKLRKKTASLDRVKTADVVITNPTHLAIVLKYDRHLMPAPTVVCKVQGDLVKRVKLLAARHQIPIIENKTFARALFSNVDLNQSISREHFPIAAMIFRDIYRQRVSN